MPRQVRLTSFLLSLCKFSLYILDSFTVQPSAGCCSARGTTAVTQETILGPTLCNPNDTGTTLTSTSTCASLTVDGSSIYIGPSTIVCCDSIPAGTLSVRLLPLHLLVPTRSPPMQQLRLHVSRVTAQSLSRPRLPATS